jgi:Flp pilus assembly pilin Flp
VTKGFSDLEFLSTPQQRECQRTQGTMFTLLCGCLLDDEGQDIAEYAVMLAVILIIVIGTIRLVGTNANTVFSNVASSVQ